MSHPSQIRSEDAVLVVVDIQERLLPAIANREEVVANTARLIQGAAELQVPIILSEQYPKGLGATVPELQTHLDAAAEKTTVKRLEKTTFACTATDAFLDMLEELGREQVLLCGIETHICVLQTALGLLEEGSIPYVVADAVGSRSETNRHLAIERMTQAKVIPAATESVLYEMLLHSKHDAFKAICSIIK